MNIVMVLVIIFCTLIVVASFAIIIKCINSSNEQLQRLEHERELEKQRIYQQNLKELELLQSIKLIQRMTTEGLEQVNRVKQSVTESIKISPEKNIALGCSGFYKELARSVKPSDGETIGLVIHREVDEEMAKLESAMLVLSSI